MSTIDTNEIHEGYQPMDKSEADYKSVENCEGFATVNEYFGDEQLKGVNTILGEERRGAKTIRRNIRRMIHHQEQLRDAFTNIQVTLEHKPGRQPVADLDKAQHSAVKATRKMLGLLSTPSLRSRATLFGIDYDAYDSQEEVIEAILEAMYLEESHDNTLSDDPE